VIFKPRRLAEISPSWEVATSLVDGRVSAVRFRRKALKATDRAEFPLQLLITIQIAEPNQYGLPTEAENVILQNIESEMVNDFAGKAHLIAVVTTNLTRQLLWYTNDAKWAVRSVANLQERLQSHVCSNKLVDDPDWGQVQHIMNTARKSTFRQSKLTTTTHRSIKP
jgi:hypothetical protein